MANHRELNTNFYPTVCFYCGKYGYFKENCSSRLTGKQPIENSITSEKTTSPMNMTVEELEGNNENFDPWMLVERKFHRKSRDIHSSETGIKDKKQESSRFMTLVDLKMNVKDNIELNAKDLKIRRNKRNERLPVDASGMENMRKLREHSNKYNNDLGFKNLARLNQFNKKKKWASVQI